MGARCIGGWTAWALQQARRAPAPHAPRRGCPPCHPSHALMLAHGQIITGEIPTRGRMREITVPDEAPQEAVDLIDRCLSQDPAARPTAKEAVLALERMGARQRAEVRWGAAGPAVAEGAPRAGCPPACLPVAAASPRARAQLPTSAWRALLPAARRSRRSGRQRSSSSGGARSPRSGRSTCGRQRGRRPWCVACRRCSEARLRSLRNRRQRPKQLTGQLCRRQQQRRRQQQQFLQKQPRQMRLQAGRCSQSRRRRRRRRRLLLPSSRPAPLRPRTRRMTETRLLYFMPALFD